MKSINLLCAAKDLESQKENLVGLLKETVGKTIKYANGNTYTIKNVDSNYIETVEGKVFGIDNLDISGFDENIANSYNQYIALNNKYSNFLKNMKYSKGTLVGSDTKYREEFFNEFLKQLPFDNIVDGNKRSSDPHYLHLNLKDEFYSDNDFKKGSFFVGINIAFSLLSTYVYVEGAENRAPFIDKIRQIFKDNGISHVVEEASIGDEDSKMLGIRIHDNFELYLENYSDSIAYLLELLRDTLYVIKEAKMFSK